ncbi:MAG: hypothetical protein K6G63_09750 [Eubacterium sp.]|nr:hypothetical protein [Eubacterium sp.]
MIFNIPVPIFLIIFAIAGAWILYQRTKSDKLERRETERFWDREEQANHTRSKDISDLPLLKVNSSEIPLPQTEDANINHYQALVMKLIDRPMLDLSKYTNTDLKLSYGVGNFKTLCDFDENFFSFTKSLKNLAKAYRTADMPKEAETVEKLLLDLPNRCTVDIDPDTDAN